MARQSTPPSKAARAAFLTAFVVIVTACSGSTPSAASVATLASGPAATNSEAHSCADSASDVPTFRGDAARTGRMPGPLPLTAPTIAWQLQAGGPLHASPAVAAGTVFQSTNSGSLMAVDLGTGAIRWRAELDGFLTSPTVVDEVVVVGSTKGWLKAFDRVTGSVRWTLAAGGQVRAAPAPFEDGVIAGSSAGKVIFVRVADGSVGWTADVTGEVARSAAIAGSTVVVPVEPGAMVALDARSGDELWRASIAKGGDVGTPSIDAGRVLAASGLDAASAADRGIVAVDLETGAQLWHWASPTGDRIYTPAMRDRGAFVVSEGGFAAALDPATGRELWRTEVAGPAEANAVVTGDVVGVADDGGTVSALDATDGRIRWHVPIEGVPAAPVATCGFVLVASEFGTLTAFGSPS